MIDVWTIILWVAIDTIVDVIVFRLFGVGEITLVVDILLNLVVPSSLFMIGIRGMSVDEFATAYAAYVENLMYWLASCMIGLPFSYMINVILGVFVRERDFGY
jgi:hypothetical protein